MLVCALVTSAPGSTKRAVMRPANGARIDLIVLHGLQALDVGLGDAGIGLELQHRDLRGVAPGEQLLRARQIAALVLEVGHGRGILLIDLGRLDQRHDLPGLTRSPRSTCSDFT